MFGSKPFSHALGLVTNPVPITFIQNNKDGIIPLVRFEKKVLKSLNRKTIKINQAKITSHFPDLDTEPFYNEYLDMIRVASDFSFFFQEAKSDKKSIPIIENFKDERDIDVTEKNESKKLFNKLFDKYTKYGVKYAFFSNSDDIYLEDLEDTFKFGANSPQIYSHNGYNYVNLNENEKKNYLEDIDGTNKPVKLSKICSGSIQNTKNFFTELFISLKYNKMLLLVLKIT